MRNSLTVLMAVSCLMIATSSFAQGKPPPPAPAKTDPASGDPAQKTINYVEIIQLDPKTQAFTARLVDVRTEKILLEVSGKGTQMQDFLKQSAAIAPRDQTVSLTGPSAGTADIIVKPPVPPGPPGEDMLRLASQVARSYEASLAQQLKHNIQPLQLRPGAIPPRIQPGVQPSVTTPNVQPIAPAPKK